MRNPLLARAIRPAGAALNASTCDVQRAAMTATNAAVNAPVVTVGTLNPPGMSPLPPRKMVSSADRWAAMSSDQRRDTLYRVAGTEPIHPDTPRYMGEVSSELGAIQRDWDSRQLAASAARSAYFACETGLQQSTVAPPTNTKSSSQVASDPSRPWLLGMTVLLAGVAVFVGYRAFTR